MTAPAIPALAAFAVSLRDRPLPADVEALAGTLLADAVGCAVFGHRFPWSRMVRGVAGLPEGVALPLAGEGAGARRAEALAWGVQAHAFELDSLRSPGAGVHPGATVALPALAVARAGGASGAALMRAIVAGVEVMFRIGAATLHTPERRGFHAPGLTGPFGAAVAAGLLMGLDEVQLANALGIAASLGGGLLAFSRSASGGMVKRLHMGRAAEAGVLAAELAAGGYEGPETAIDGRFGLLEAACDSRDPARLLAGLGEAWEIRRSCLKLYACHVTAHPPVHALTTWMRETGVAAGEIAGIRLLCTPKVLSHHGSTQPADLMQAQYSVPFMLATAAVRGLDDPRGLGDGLLADAGVRAFCDRITLAEATTPGQGSWGATLVVTTTDGTETTLAATGFPGMPETSMPQAQLAAKLATLLRDDVPDSAAAVRGLLQLPAAANVAEALRSVLA